MNPPQISVVMPVYNGQKYLNEAINSILNQTFRNFEFIIINDGSTDQSLEIIERYQKIDNRIILISRENRGLSASLNDGIEKAQGQYIARMDADDISIHTRLQEQFDFLLENSHIDILGSWIEVFGSKSHVGRYLLGDDQIKSFLLFNSALAHPSVMLKRKIFDRCQYREEFDGAEDYGLWVELANEHRFANIPRVLLRYRNHPKQTTEGIKLQKSDSVRKMILQNYDFDFSAKEIDTYFDVCHSRMTDFNKTIGLLNKILKNRKINETLDLSMAQSTLGRILWRLVSLNKQNRLKNFIAFHKSHFYIKENLQLIDYIKFFVRLVFRFEDGR